MPPATGGGPTATSCGSSMTPASWSAVRLRSTTSVSRRTSGASSVRAATTNAGSTSRCADRHRADALRQPVAQPAAPPGRLPVRATHGDEPLDEVGVEEQVALQLGLVGALAAEQAVKDGEVRQRSERPAIALAQDLRGGSTDGAVPLRPREDVLVAPAPVELLLAARGQERIHADECLEILDEGVVERCLQDAESGVVEVG